MQNSSLLYEIFKIAQFVVILAIFYTFPMLSLNFMRVLCGIIHTFTSYYFIKYKQPQKRREQSNAIKNKDFFPERDISDRICNTYARDRYAVQCDSRPKSRQ